MGESYVSRGDHTRRTNEQWEREYIKESKETSEWKIMPAWKLSCCFARLCTCSCNKSKMENPILLEVLKVRENYKLQKNGLEWYCTIIIQGKVSSTHKYFDIMVLPQCFCFPLEVILKKNKKEEKSFTRLYFWYYGQWHFCTKSAKSIVWTHLLFSPPAYSFSLPSLSLLELTEVQSALNWGRPIAP